MDVFGGHLGGMLVSVTGRRPNGNRARIEWHLTAGRAARPRDSLHGAILLARKARAGRRRAAGCIPLHGVPRAAEFESEFARLAHHHGGEGDLRVSAFAEISCGHAQPFGAA